MNSSRPELIAPAEFFYNQSEAEKYGSRKRNLIIQEQLTRRALEMLLLPNRTCLLLDIGCGTCISSRVLSEEGHEWIGVDLSSAMLDIALESGALENGDLLQADIGQRLRFRPGSFDGCIGISSLQWLCNADKKEHKPFSRLTTFFRWLYASLSTGGRAVFQFYPNSPEQIEMITSAALKSGFGGGLVVDYPNSTKAKKYFLCLWAGFSGAPPQLPSSLENTEDFNSIQNTKAEKIRSSKSSKKGFKSREWIINKKEKQRRQGKIVRPDSKYTGRKRKDKF